MVTCQWHFKNSVSQKANAVVEQHRDHFINSCLSLCTAASTTGYFTVKAEIDNYAVLYPLLKPWIQWWNARRSHICGAFRGFGFTGASLAEIGNSTVQECKPITLVKATCKDCAMMIAQDEEIEAFEQNVGQCSGQGANQIARAEDARRSQINEARHWADLMKDRSAMCQESQQEWQAHSFIPSSKASHKPPNKSHPKLLYKVNPPTRSNRVPARAITLHSMQERLKQAQEIAMQSGNEPVSNESGRSNTSTDICSPRPIGESGKTGRGRGGRGRGKNTQNIPAATFPTSTQSTQDTSMQSTAPSSAVPLNPTQTCPLRPSAYLPANSPMVTLFRLLVISTCKGCGGFIDRHNFPPGGDLALRLKAVKFFKNPRT